MKQRDGATHVSPQDDIGDGSCDMAMIGRLTVQPLTAHDNASQALHFLLPAAQKRSASIGPAINAMSVVMRGVEEVDCSLFEQSYQKQTGDKSSNVCKPGDSSASLSQA